jgi:hypothetical protein
MINRNTGLEVPVLASLPRRNQRSPALCGCKKHGMDLSGDHTSTCTAHSGATKAHDWAVGVLGPCFVSARTIKGIIIILSSRQLDTSSAHNTASQQAQANGAATWRYTVFSKMRRAVGAWSLTCPSHTTESAAAATCSRTVCYRIPRTLTPPCYSLRSAKLTTIGSNTLTTRTFLFSPPL